MLVLDGLAVDADTVAAFQVDDPDIDAGNADFAVPSATAARLAVTKLVSFLRMSMSQDTAASCRSCGSLTAVPISVISASPR